MSDLGATILDSLQGVITDATTEIRYAGTKTALAGTITAATVAGLERTKLTTDQGASDDIDGVVRYKASLEPAAWKASLAIMGEVIKILGPGEDADAVDAVWYRCRVANRKVVAGAVRLSVVAEFQEI